MNTLELLTHEWNTWKILLVIWVVICAINIPKIIKYIAVEFKIWQSNGKIVSSKGHWFWGHALKFGPTQEGILARWELMKKFPKVHLMKYGPVYTAISCYEPYVVGQILNKANIPKNNIMRTFFKPWIGDGLLMSSGKKWKRNRKLLTPAFHFEILKNYVEIFNLSVDVMISKFKKTEDAIDCFQPVSMLALDNMLQCMMSCKTDCQLLGEAHPYVKAIHDIASGIIQRFFLQPFSRSDFLFSLTNIGKKYNAALKVSNEQTTTVIQKRLEALKHEENSEMKNKKKKDFLDILILARDTNGNSLGENEIRDEVETFLFAGHDTTAASMLWILYDLATNPEHQSKCREEVKEILGDGDEVERDDLSKFNHLSLCIKESLRIHPPVPYCFSRGLEEPLKINGDFGKDQLNANTNDQSGECSHEFPKNTKLEISILMMHHNPHVWEEPEKFDPYRFTPENYSKIPHFAYIPFSAGPRNCIGQNFAMMEIKITMAKMLKNFEFYIDETCPEPSMTTMPVLRSKTGFYLRFRNISETK